MSPFRKALLSEIDAEVSLQTSRPGCRSGPLLEGGCRRETAIGGGMGDNRAMEPHPETRGEQADRLTLRGVARDFLERDRCL